MSWGGPPTGHTPYYGGQQLAHQLQPQGGGYTPAPGAPPASTAPYGAPVSAPYNPQYSQQGAPPPGQYGAPRPGAPPPQHQGYGAPPPQHGAPPPQQQYGAPPSHTPGYNPGGGSSPYNPAYNPGPAPHQQHQYGAPGGYGAPPPQQGGYRPPGPPGGYGPPGRPNPGISPELWGWFQAVDQDGSGRISAHELQQALMNGNWTPFNVETCRLMISMFDRERKGTIDPHQFVDLWKYIQDWKNNFMRYDTDRSGNINAQELHMAFQCSGYNLSAQFCQLCVRIFDRDSIHSMKFDDYIQCCVMLRLLTDQFRQKDTQQAGMINISYEEFLRMVMDNALVI